MSKGPIVIIDDEKDDINFLKEALSDLKVENKIVSFNDSLAALNFLETTDEKPFLVICDIQMPRINGLELRKKLHSTPNLLMATFPFMFLSTGGGHPFINDAYGMSVQGYFIKPTNLADLQEMLTSIISYWTWSEHPVLIDYNSL